MWAHRRGLLHLKYQTSKQKRLETLSVRWVTLSSFHFVVNLMAKEDEIELICVTVWVSSATRIWRGAGIDHVEIFLSLCSDLLANYTAPACNTHSITMISGQGFWNAVGNECKYKLSLKRVSTRDHATRSRPKDDKVHVVIFKWTASWQKIVGWRDSQTLHT